ncbi:hypothetical protein GCM10029978_067100 [Actinoallomurus acanthiterrae]
MTKDLPDRAAARRKASGDQSPDERGATGSETRSDPGENALKTLRGQIMQMRDEFQMAMPRGIEAAQLIRDAITCLRTTRGLARCDPLSLLGGLMTCAQLGLRPGVDGLGHAWLIPRWDEAAGCQRASLVIGYQGFVELAYRSPKVLMVAARTVFHADDFTITWQGPDDEFAHRPYLDGDPGEPRLYYALARLAGGGYTFTRPTNVASMRAHRDKYAPRNRYGEIVGPWVDFEEQMSWKTEFLRLSKYLPKSTDFSRALAIDNGIRTDPSPTVDPEDVTTHPATILGHIEAGTHDDAEHTSAPGAS